MFVGAEKHNLKLFGKNILPLPPISIGKHLAMNDLENPLPDFPSLLIQFKQIQAIAL